MTLRKLDENIDRVDYWLENTLEFLPGVSIDCIVFGFSEGVMKVLLGKIRNYHKWMLPGGVVHKTESIEEAAHRILVFRTGLKKVPLRQFHTFGDENISKAKDNIELVQLLTKKIIPEGKHWFTERFITLGYYTFVNYNKVNIIDNENNKHEELQWFHLDDIPQLFSDHNLVLETALKELRGYIINNPFGMELLPEKFTMTELRTIYESTINRKVDRRNFQRKMLATGYVIKLDEMKHQHGIKATHLFTFHKEKYHKGFSLFE